MSINVNQNDPSKQVTVEIDPTQEGETGSEAFSVRGRIVDAAGVVQPDITVRAYHKTLNDVILLGETLTNATGNYLIYYSNELLPSLKLRADLIVRLFDVSQVPEALLAESSLKLNADKHVIINLTTDPDNYTGPSEYQQMFDLIDPQLSGIDLTTIDKQGIIALGSTIGKAAVHVKNFIEARLLALQVSVSEEVLYGMMRYGLPSTFQPLLNVAVAIKRQSILSAARSNIINPAIENDIDAILAVFAAALVDNALTDLEDLAGESYLAKLLFLAGLDATQQSLFYTEYLNNGDLGEDFWAHLVTSGTLDATLRDATRHVFQLSAITQKHLPLIQVVFNDAAIEDTEDLVNYTYSDWLSHIDQPVIGVPGIPEEELTDELRQDYANALMQAIADAFPGQMFRRNLLDNPDYNGTLLEEFFNDNPDYDINDTSPLQYLADNPTAMDTVSDPVQGLEDLNRTKRLFHLTEGYNRDAAVRTLADNGLDSATRIASYGRRAFVNRYAVAVGGVDIARKIYINATKRSAASMTMYAAHNSGFNSVSTRVFKDGLPDNGPGTAGYPELEVLFGAQDYCACEHCNSSFSPAAYLVDTLSFIRNAENVAPGATQNAWEILGGRRPEMEYIHLSCENTNTTMPYIDLVNEVLEYVVADPNGELSRQTTMHEKLLLAEPEHTNTIAYDTLAQQTYPWILPFHLWNEEARVYLGQANVERSDLVRALANNDHQTAPISSEEAQLFLGISEAMLGVLTAAGFTEAYGGGSIAAADFNNNIPLLLERSGLTYDELLELLGSQYINPTNKQITFLPESSCTLTDAQLVLVGTELNRLHRFTRLKNILGWSVAALDMAITAFNTTINGDFLVQLAGIKKLQQRFKLPPEEIISWYGNLSDILYGEDLSQYQSIYLNPLVTGTTDTATLESMNIDILDEGGTGDLIPESARLISGALRLRDQDLLLLLGDIASDGVLGIEQLSELYRIVSFTRALRIKIPDYLQLRTIIGGNTPIRIAGGNTNPDDTLAFLARTDILNNAKFSVAELDYLFNNVLTNAFVEATDGNITQKLNALKTELLKRFSDIGITGNNDAESLTNAFLFLTNEEIATISMHIVENGTTGIGGEAAEEAEVFINTHWNVGADAGESVLATLTPLATPEERYSYVMELLYPQFSEVLLFNEAVLQFMTEAYTASPGIVVTLLTDELENPSDASQSALSLFISSDFVFATSDISNIPPFEEHYLSVKQLLKILLLIKKLNIRAEDLSFVINTTANTGWLDLKALGDATYGGGITPLIKLTQAYQLENSYEKGEDFSIIKLLEAINNSGTAPNVDDLSLLAEVTGWELEDIQYLTNTHFSFLSADYRDEQWLLKIEDVLGYVVSLNSSPAELSLWTAMDISADNAQLIKMRIRSKYDEGTWLKTAENLRNTLRIKQRDALSAYLIADNPDFEDTNDLYEHYLIDPEMAPCAMTSRIKIALSTVQLWVQRIQMNLEPGIAFTEEDLDEWKWRKNYRVWEAGRKVFTYPENWIEPELRDDKSSSFIEMEDELLQEEVTMESAERVYLNYLRKLDEMSNLEIAGMHKEEDSNVYHVFARTKNTPNIYYYRKWEDGYHWTAWQRLDLDIEGNHLIPVVFNRRIMLFWPVMSEKPVEVTNDDLNTSNASQPEKKIEIKMAYSEYWNNSWQSKKVSQTRMLSPTGAISADFFFKTLIDEEGLSIDTYVKTGTYENYSEIGRFFLNNCTAEIEISEDTKETLPAPFSITDTKRFYMKLYQQADSNAFEITQEVRADYTLALSIAGDAYTFTTLPFIKKISRSILGVSPSLFKVTYPVSGADILYNKPFFYEDKQRTFFVVPGENTFQRDVIIHTHPRILVREADTLVDEEPPTTEVDNSDDQGGQIPNSGSGSDTLDGGDPENGKGHQK